MADIKKFSYLKSGITAKGHTPIYKFHKYFARRPHNVFRHIIEHYTQKGDVVVDCFSGGGVTVAEGVRLSRKILGIDLNPLAAFVSNMQLTPVDTAHYIESIEKIERQFIETVEEWYTTDCRSCAASADVRWYEHAYDVKCPHCLETTSLKNENKFEKNGKAVNGSYACTSCRQLIKAADVERIGSTIISLRYRCCECGDTADTHPSHLDHTKYNRFIDRYDELVTKHSLSIPQDKIPDYWDRQQEDCLHRKGIHTFSDLFTKRNLIATALLKKIIQENKASLDNSVYKMLIFTFSATLRYVNNLTFSTSSWMGGRPVAWAKHAYWIPNQFVEVNPIEYFEKRKKAFVSSLKYQNTEFRNLCSTNTPSDLLSIESKASHSILCQSSSSIPLPDNSVSAVITDPPYGSNVQYGELSQFWLVWLKDELSDYQIEPNLPNEILTHRKTKYKGYSKTDDDYYRGLKSVFIDCFRVLKDGAPLIFTFNNKDLSVWIALIRAALEAGFTLESDGVIYQEPIEIYRDTAHSRYDGALRGDFIYTFRKTTKLIEISNELQLLSVKDVIINTALEQTSAVDSFTKREIHVGVYKALIPMVVQMIENKTATESMDQFCNSSVIDDVLSASELFILDQGVWRRDTGVVI